MKYLIKDIDCELIVEPLSRKELLDYIDEHLDNLRFDIDMSDYSFKILYKDGSFDCVVGDDYDGHKIKRINIVAMVVDNPCTSQVFGNYEVNRYGVVVPSFEMKIDENIDISE